MAKLSFISIQISIHFDGQFFFNDLKFDFKNFKKERLNQNFTIKAFEFMHGTYQYIKGEILI